MPNVRWFQRDINFPTSFFFTCDFLATFLRLTCDFLATYLRVSCYFLATFLRLSCDILSTFLRLSCYFLATFLRLTCDFLATFLRLSCPVTQLSRGVDGSGYIAEKQHELSAMKFLSIFIFIFVCSTSTAVLPTYSPAMRQYTNARSKITLTLGLLHQRSHYFS